jgi:hypothetical protein
MNPKSVEGSAYQNKCYVFCLFLSCALILNLGSGLPSIDAINFGIVLDNTCKTILRNNVTSNCPTYEDVITVFPDTSIQDVSGRFDYFDGIYQRGPEKLHNSFEY